MVSDCQPGGIAMSDCSDEIYLQKLEITNVMQSCLFFRKITPMKGPAIKILKVKIVIIY